jgi:hypothetical protein
MPNNATNLFEGQARHTRNSESWWSAFFSQYLIYRARAGERCGPSVYTYSVSGGYRTAGRFPLDGISYNTLFVEPQLTRFTFGLPTWPKRFLRLRPDILVLRPTARAATLVEVKTIGASIKKNVSLYSEICKNLADNSWSVDLLHLLSHGHETAGDRALIAQMGLHIMLWEDVLRDVHKTPLAQLFGFDLSPYASAPEEPVDGAT